MVLLLLLLLFWRGEWLLEKGLMLRLFNNPGRRRPPPAPLPGVGVFVFVFVFEVVNSEESMRGGVNERMGIDKTLMVGAGVVVVLLILIPLRRSLGVRELLDFRGRVVVLFVCGSAMRGGDNIVSTE
jgi:hypothetical protein